MKLNPSDYDDIARLTKLTNWRVGQVSPPDELAEWMLKLGQAYIPQQVLLAQLNEEIEGGAVAFRAACTRLENKRSELLRHLTQAVAEQKSVEWLTDKLNPLAPKPAEFINHYTCPRCSHQWQDRWSAMCDDDCPSCGLRHITPTHSEDCDE